MKCRPFIGKILSLIGIGIMCGCDMIEYHPYDLDVSGETHINAKNITLIEEKTKDKDEISFVVISDTQRWYDETEEAVKVINKMEGVDFVLHTGDISDFGLKKEYELQRDILNRLNVPYVVVLGNHDCLGTGKRLFNKIFGEFDYAFTAGFVRFLCVNTNSLEFDRDVRVPDLKFLERELEYAKDPTSGITKTVVAMHCGPYSEQFNTNSVELFHYTIKHFPKLQFCVYGHWHQFEENDFFNDGIKYFECTCAKKRGMLRFTINKNQEEYKHERITY